ncbi:MAG: SEC-C metal-binding domain-containing protein [Deferrisomatales bacterium]|nr:SEC-C metal-binding domain-containing protein [Deferrisomatales bacterium]
MIQTGRNDPCPCGSGKKFKKCCMREEQEVAGIRQEGAVAVRTALAWLAEHHPEEVEDAVQQFYFTGLEEAELAVLDGVASGTRQMLDINVGEWLVTDARFQVGAERKSARELLFAPGGPPLTVHGRQWLEEISQRPLGLFEVTRVEPGEGVELRDFLRPDAAPVRVWERTASYSMVPQDLLGARPARHSDTWVFTGAIYPLGREDAEACREEILEELGEAGWDAERARDLVGRTIATCWLRSVVEESSPAG